MDIPSVLCLVLGLVLTNLILVLVLRFVGNKNCRDREVKSDENWLPEITLPFPGERCLGRERSCRYVLAF